MTRAADPPGAPTPPRPASPTGSAGSGAADRPGPPDRPGAPAESGEPVGPGEPAGAAEPASPAGVAGAALEVPAPRRVRVVLAGPRRVPPGPARRELEEHTGVGDVLVGGLIRAQLGLALRLALLVAVLFGSLPLIFALAPAVSRARLFGIELPWLLLGVLPYPVLIGIAIGYVRLAERNEQEFADMVDQP